MGDGVSGTVSSHAAPGEGALYVVATPIGNLADITLRALEVLRSASLILVEDTRTSAKLLARYQVTTPLRACHEHNERALREEMVARIARGEKIALISDAGTPLVSDPGYHLLRACLVAGLPVHPVPGPSSVMAALCVSGLPPYPFTFLGFLPRSGSSRRRRIAEVLSCPHTTVILESTRRLCATLTDLDEAGGGALHAVIAREMTKLHEAFLRGSVRGLRERLTDQRLRGEAVLLLAPPQQRQEAVDDAAIIHALADDEIRGLAPSVRAKTVAGLLGVDRRRVYALLHRVG